MKTIIRKLPRELDQIELHILADEHIGDLQCNIANLKSKIDYIRNTDNCFCILNGDILDFATRDSIGDVESRNMNIMEQINRGLELLTPIKDKIISITTGNHENRAYRRDGIDVSQIVATQLGLAEVYSPTSCLIFLSVGNGNSHNGNKQILYTLYHLHGSGGGRKEGGKANRLADMASIIDADIYIHSHTHLPMIMKEGFFRVDTHNKSIMNVTKLFVNTASNLDYGGYGEAMEFKPSSTETPKIHLNGKNKHMFATL